MGFLALFLAIGFVFVVVIPLALLVSPYLTGPFLIKKIMKAHLNPVIESFNPSSIMLPDIAHEFFQRTQRELENLGFRAIENMLLPNMIPNMTKMVVFFQKSACCEYAIVSFDFIQFDFIQNSIAGTETTSHVDFEVELSSGISISVNNAPSMSAFAIPDNYVQYQFPDCHDLDYLYEIFQKLSNKTGANCQRVDQLTSKYHGKPTEMIRQGILKEFNREVDRGRMYIDHQTQQYCFNTFNAFRFSWMFLFPFKQLRLIANRRRNRQLLDELGIS